MPASVRQEPEPERGRIPLDDMNQDRLLEVVNRPSKPVLASRRAAPPNQIGTAESRAKLPVEQTRAADSCRHGAAPPREAEATNRAVDVARRAAAITRTRADGFLDRPQKRSSRGNHRPSIEFGSHASQDGVHFIQPTTVGRRVVVSGDFNNWSDSGVLLELDESRDVLWARVELPPGVWQYRLIIDGRWTPDPYNPNSAPNPFGELNSIVIVQESQTPALPSEMAIPLSPRNV
jgi:hypothetical protein